MNFFNLFGMAGRGGFAFSRTLVSWTRDNSSVKALVHGYFIHNVKELFVSTVSSFREEAEFTRVVDIVGGGKFFNFPDSRLTIDRKSVEKGCTFRPATISKDEKNKNVLLVQVPSFELKEHSKSVAGWDIVPEDPQQRKDRRDRGAKQDDKKKSTDPKSKDKPAGSKPSKPVEPVKSDPPSGDKEVKVGTNSMEISMDDLTKRLTALKGLDESVVSKKGDTSGWANDISGKTDIDRLEYARGEIKSFVQNGRKRSQYFKVTNWTFEREYLEAGDEIDVVIDLSTSDLCGYKGGETPVACLGYIIDGRSFVFVQPSK